MSDRVPSANAVQTTSSRPRAILASALGQIDNVGDTVLRRALFDALRANGPLTVFVGGREDSYVDGLGLTQADTIIRSSRKWRTVLSRSLVSGRCIYAFGAGEMQIDLKYAATYARLLPLLLI